MASGQCSKLGSLLGLGFRVNFCFFFWGEGVLFLVFFVRVPYYFVGPPPPQKKRDPKLRELRIYFDFKVPLAPQIPVTIWHLA